MKVRLKLARIGMNMEEGTIVEWHKKEGQLGSEAVVTNTFAGFECYCVRMVRLVEIIQM